LNRIELLETRHFKIHCLDGHIQTSYLVEYPDKLLLLDGGCRCDSGQIRDFIHNTLNRPFQDLKLCVVSHMHPDHAGGACSLRSRTGAEIAAMEMIDQWYRGIGGYFQHKVDTYLAWWVSKKQNRRTRRIFYPKQVKPDYLLKHNDPLPGFPDWIMVHTPGHTSHDACLFHPESGIFYAGDLLVKIKNKFLPPFPVTMPEAMCASLREVSRIPVKTLLLAHGGVINTANEPIDYELICQTIGTHKGLTFKIAKWGTQLNAEIKRAKKKKWDYH